MLNGLQRAGPPRGASSGPARAAAGPAAAWKLPPLAQNPPKEGPGAARSCSSAFLLPGFFFMGVAKREPAKPKLPGQGGLGTARKRARLELAPWWPSVPFGRQRFVTWEVIAGMSVARKRLEGKLRQRWFRSRSPPTPSQSLLGLSWLPRNLLALQPDPARGQVSSELMAGPAIV